MSYNLNYYNPNYNYRSFYDHARQIYQQRAGN